MKLTVAYRDTPAGGFSGTKHHFVAFHVVFSNEERAIIQERGLYQQSISVPSDTPPPTRSGDFLAFLLRLAGIIFVPLGLFISMVSRSGDFAGLLIIGGIALFTVGKIKDVKAIKRVTNPEQQLTFRRLLANPDFVVFAETLAEAKGMEVEVRESLSAVAQTLRDSTTVPEQTSYEL